MSDNPEMTSGFEALVARMRERSRWAVDTALAASRVQDVALTLVVQVPANPNRNPEAYLIGGAWLPDLADKF